MSSEAQPLDISIHVTHYNACPRELYYDWQGLQRAPKHYLSARGTITHKAIELALKGETVNWNYETLVGEHQDIPPQLYELLVDDAKTFYGRAREWMKTTDILRSGEQRIIESKLELLEDGVLLTGTPDLRTPRYIVDFKTGKPAKRLGYLAQLAGYGYMCKRLFNLELGGVLVFLGDNGGGAVERVLNKDDLEKGRHEFRGGLKGTVEVLRRLKKSQSGVSEFKFPCRNSFLCSFCDYRGGCRGI